MDRSKYALLAILLALLTALDALTIDLSLPAMPAIARDLGVDYTSVELGLSAYLLGIAIGQLIQGPASDRFGRKPVLLLGLALYTVATALCAAAPSIAMLTILRVIQGLAASTGQILARAIVRDKFARDEAARLLSFAMMGLAFAPILAPILGSMVSSAFGWRPIFALLAIYSSAIAILIWRFLEETNTDPDGAALAPRNIATTYRAILSSRIFWSYGLCGIASFCGLFAFLTASPGIFINHLGLSVKSFGMVFAGIMVGHMFALLLGARLVRRFGLDRLLLAGVGAAALAGIAAIGLDWRIGLSSTSIWGTSTVVLTIAVPVAIYMAAFALIIPQAVAGAMAPFPNRAGAAASLMGFLQFTAASATTTLVAFFSDGSQTAMITAIGCAGLVGLASWIFLVRPIAVTRAYS